MYVHTHIHTCSVQLWADFLFNCSQPSFAWSRLPTPPHQPQLGPELPSSPTTVSSMRTHTCGLLPHSTSRQSCASLGQCCGEAGVWNSRALSQDPSTSQGLAQPFLRCVADLASRMGLGSSTPKKRLCAAPILGHEPNWAGRAQRPWPFLGPVYLPLAT